MIKFNKTYVGVIDVAIIMVAFNYFVGRYLYKTIMDNPKKIYWCFILFFVAPLGVIGTFICATHKEAKNRQALYETLRREPNDEKVDEFIQYIEKFNTTNTPEAWQHLRTVWLRVNESSDVTTNKKRELIEYLKVKGLYIHNDEARVFDNYKEKV